MGLSRQEYCNGVPLPSPVVFPAFFNLSLNFAIRSSWSEPQSAPGLVFADCIELFYLQLLKFDFGVDHLMMFTSRAVFCVSGRGCLPWPMRSLGKTLLVFALLHFVLLRPNLPVTTGISWLPTFAFQSPMMKRTSFLVLVLGDLVGHHITVQLQLLQH